MIQITTTTLSSTRVNPLLLANNFECLCVFISPKA
jgi:hypothetical protein